MPRSEIDQESSTVSNSIEEFQKMADLKSRQCKLEEEIKTLKENAAVDLTVDDLAAVIELWTKIPVKHISEFETRRLTNLEERLHKRLIGQNEAVEAVSRAIRRKRAGKTELVKQIAREVFDGEDALIRLDMSEYMEKHSVAKLIGSPPGYVGYDDAGQLTEKVRRHPYSVILLDEIEKAHADIFHILLQILDDGRITDSHGKTVSFENTIIIMTSNAGSDQRSNVVGFNEDEEAVQIKVERALKELFRPEFLNRVDETVIFKELSRAELLQIIDLMLDDLRAGLKEKNISMEADGAAKEYILDNAYQKAYGERPLRRYIESNVEDALAQQIITGTISAGMTAVVKAENDQLCVMVK